MEQELTRIGVSLPANLLNRFDTIIAQRGYSSRSEGIRDAIRSYIVDYEWMSKEEGEKIGVITFIYVHHKRGLGDTLTDLQHKFLKLIESSLHVHIDHENCMEVVLVKGDAKDVKTLVERIMALKGVKHVKLTITSLGDGL
ncbi:MAG: nickel-responsive transcriptional regulator NikR [Methanocellales archaeon]|nr:nickel-responsive transcriptional regulator NikR [Methanocellales archaeon]